MLRCIKAVQVVAGRHQKRGAFGRAEAWRLARVLAHFLECFVVADALEFRMAQMVIGSPFVHCDFHDYLWLRPNDSLHLVRVHVVSAAFFGEIAKGTGSGFEFPDSSVHFSARGRHEIHRSSD